MTEFDNTNKGSLFIPRNDKAPCSLSGNANIEGHDFYVDLFKTDGKRCLGVLVLKAQHDASKQIAVPLFESTKGKAIMYGSFELPKFGKVYVNVLKKDRKRDNSPVLGLYFNLSDDNGGSGNKASKPVPTASEVDYEDTPF